MHGITNKNFQVEVDELTSSTPYVTLEGPEPDDQPAHATTVRYAPGAGAGAGEYLPSIVGGQFDSSADVDVYQVSVPLDIAITSGQSVTLLAAPRGASADGSPSPIGALWLVDSTTPNETFARTNGLSTILQAPVTAGHAYYLFVAHVGGGPTAFYYVETLGIAGPPPESASNDSQNNAQNLANASQAPNIESYVVSGNISPANDNDWFQISPTGKTKLTASCYSTNLGSGLQSFSITARGQNGTILPNGTYQEPSTPPGSVDALLQNVDITGITSVYLQVSALSQSATITGSFYDCEFDAY